MKKVVHFIDAKVTKNIPFDKLPVVDKCCFCYPLRIGSIIISVLCITTAVAVIIINSESSHCYPGLDLKIISSISIVTHVILLLTAIYFTYAIIKKDVRATTLLLLALTLVMISTLLEAFIWFFTRNNNPSKCPRTFVFAGALIMRLFVFFYFLITVNSYRVYYISENRNEIVANLQQRAENMNKTLHETIEKKIDQLTVKK